MPNKYIIACSVREVKEQDFKKTIALKKWQQELLKYHKLRLLSTPEKRKRQCRYLTAVKENTKIN